MTKYEKITKTVEENKIIEHTCDFCGKNLIGTKMKQEQKEACEILDLEEFGDFWSDIDVTMRISQGYPECTDTMRYEIDICIPCFKTYILDKAKQHTCTESSY